MSKTADKKKKPELTRVRFKKPPHEHDYKKAGMSIYCKCGDVRTLTCAHEWQQDRVDSISIEKMGGEIHQRREMRVCKNCGALAMLNTTTGSCVINH